MIDTNDENHFNVVNTQSNDFCGIGKDFKSEFISEIYEFMNKFHIEEKFEIENEIKDVAFLYKIMREDYPSFDRLIRRDGNC